MRVSLANVDLEALDLELPGEAGREHGSAAKVRTLRGLRGRLEQGEGKVRLEEARAAEAILDALRMVFGAVVIEETGEATLSALELSLVHQHDALTMTLGAEKVNTTHLSVKVGIVDVGGRAAMRPMRVDVRGGEGTFEAEAVHIEGFSLRIGDALIRAPSVSASRLQVGWGSAGFRLAIDSLDASGLSVGVGPLKLEGEGLEVRSFAIHEGHYAIESATLASTEIEFALDDGASTEAETGEIETGEIETGETETGETETGETETDRSDEIETGTSDTDEGGLDFDWRLLDGLSGAVNVNLRVDLAVPVLGRRRATHRFRVPIDGGSLNFRELEEDLSTLENTLLDFSVRDDARLVLERGIPLLPTRGRGKPILTWDLSPEDHALADRKRVRLAVLPHFRLTPEAAREEKDEGREPAIRLRDLGLESVDVRLALHAPELSGAIASLAFESLRLEGGVHPMGEGAPRPGELRGAASKLEASLRALPLGSERMHVSGLGLEALEGFVLTFRGAKPNAASAKLTKLSLARLEIGAAGDLPDEATS